MEKPFHDTQEYFQAFIRTAQYIPNLTTRQDILAETGRVLVSFFKADLVGFFERAKDGRIEGHHWILPDGVPETAILTRETETIITGVFETGFLAAQQIEIPEPFATVFLPIIRENQTAVIMLVGHRTSNPLPKELLDIYLAVTGLVRDVTERKSAEFLLQRFNDELEQQVKVRTEELHESRGKYRDLVENIDEVILSVDLQGNFTYISPVIERLYGYSPEEVTGQHFLRFIHPDDHAHCIAGFRRQLDGEYGKDEFRILSKSGTIHYVRVSQRPIEKDGRVSGFNYVMTDITGRKLAEERLEHERKQLLSIFNSVDDIIYVCDPDTYEILYVNDALLRSFKKNPVGGLCYQEFQGFDKPCGFCTNEIILKDKDKPYRWEYHNPVIDRDFEMVDRIITWPDGRDVRFEFAKDISERKKAEEEERLTRERFETLVKVSGMQDASETELSQYVMEAACRMTGSTLAFIGTMTPDESVMDIVSWSSSAMQECGVALSPIHFPVQRAGLWADAIRMRKPKIVNDYSAPLPDKKGLPEGHARITRFLSLPILDKGKVVLVAAVANKPDEYDDADVTRLTLLMQGVWGNLEKRRAEEALRENEIRFRELFNSLHSGVAVYRAVDNGEDFEFVDFNPGAEKIEGIEKEQVIGRRVTEVFPGVREFGIMDVLQRVWRTGKPEHFPISQYKDDRIASWRENYVYRLPSGEVVAIYDDVTEHMLAEEGILKAQQEVMEHDQFLQRLIETIPNPVFYKDKNGIYTGCNTAFEGYIGLSKHELIGKSVYDISPKDLADIYYANDRKLLDNPGTQIYESRVKYADGSIHDVIFNKATFTDLKGNVEGLVGIIVDISGRKNAEEAVQAAVKLNALIDTMSVGESMGYTLDEAERLTTSQIGFFHLINPDEQTIELIAWSTKTKKHCFIPKEPERHYPVDKAGVWVDCMRERRPVIHNDYTSLPHRKGLPEGHVPVIRELVVPIIDEDKIVAIIGVGNKATDYDENDISILSLLAKNAWTLILRKRAEEERERIRSWQAGVNRILESVLAPAPLDQKLKIITDGVVETFGADFCRIWLIERGDLCNAGCMHAEVTEGPHVCRYRDKCLRLKVSSGRYTHIDGKGHRRVPFGAYKIGRIASGEESKFLTNDVEHDPRVHDHAWAKNLGLVAFAGYRLKPPDGDVLGVFALFTRFPIPPDMDTILDGLSRAISLVIQKDIAEAELHESRTMYRDLVENINDVIFSLDLQGTFTYISPVIERLYGYHSDEVMGQHFSKFLHPDDHPQCIEAFKKRLKGEYGINNFRIRCKDGREEDVCVSQRPMVKDGVVTGFNYIMSNITARKRAEDALRTSEERFRTMIEQSPLSIEVMSPDGRTLQVNPAFVKLWGVTLEDLKDYNMLKDEQLTRLGIMPYIQRGFSGEAVAYPAVQYDGSNTLGFGDKKWVQGSIYPVRDTAGTIRNVILVHEDITEQKKAEEALRESEEKFRDIFDNANDGIEIVELLDNGLPGRYLDLNEVACRMVLYTKEELLRLSPLDINTDYFSHPFDEIMRELHTAGHATFETEHRRKDGIIVPVEINSHKITLMGKTVLLSIARDITERKRAKDALKESEQKFRDIFNNTTDAIHIHGINNDGTPGRFTDVNDVACRMLGYTKEEMLAKTPLDIATGYHNPPLEKILEAQRTVGVARFETEYRAKDGTIIPVEVNTHVVTIQGTKVMLGVVRDIAERKKAEALLKHFNEELEQEVKVRTEELSASLEEKVILLREVHHRVKNNLQIIISLVNLQMRQIDDPRLKQVMAETQNRVRAMSFVHEKLYQSEDISRIDLATYTRFLVSQLFSFYGVDSRKVTLDIDIGKIMITINTAIPLGLIINELASNVLKHAFPNDRTGTLSLFVREEAKTLHLIVRDDGAGVPAEFDWRNAESLGLRLVISLVEQLDGTIELDRSAGSVFTIVVQEKD
ncbi:MAG: PAS domain S-box protein [Methanoregula sp.]|nr:PAS domain S-box protein [Methanoregula sp.]